MLQSRALLIAFVLGLVPSTAMAGPAGQPIREDVPWAQHTGDDLDLTPLERDYGIEESELPEVDSFWQGSLLYTGDSRARGTLSQQDLPPLPAQAYDAAPGILYVAADGVVLRPTCGNGDSANSALNCSPLVSEETTFPAFGNGSQQAALFNQLASYYQAFDLVLTSSRPPDWVPYTMAVVGGSSANAGFEGGTCGVANVACDGLKRNHVSLTFTNCGGTANTAAQETAHNWGLEHTDNQNDLLYPFNGGGAQSFVDQCMNISHATSKEPITQCDYIHEAYCPNGGGEQQNTFQELLGVFGPRSPDTTPPEIISFSPADGSTFTSDDSILITASVSEDSNFLAAHWTLEGGDTELSRCTNKTCDSDFNVGVGFDPNEIEWDFANLNGAPEGTYNLMFEVLDAYGNYDSVTFSFDVVAGSGTGATSNPTDPTDGEDSSTGDDETTGDSDSDSGTGGSASNGGNDDDDDDDDDDGDTDTAGGTGGEPPGESCACTTAPQRGSMLSTFMLFALGITLRRRRA